MNHQRSPGQPGGHAAGTANESTHAEHRCGAATKDYAERLQQRPANLKRSNQQCDCALAPQSLHTDPFDIDTGRGYDARLEAPPRTEPDDLLRLRLQEACNRQCGIDMSTRAARHHQNRSDAHFFLPRFRLTGFASTASS